MREKPDHLDRRHAVDSLRLDGRAPRRKRVSFADVRRVFARVTGVLGAAWAILDPVLSHDVLHVDWWWPAAAMLPHLAIGARRWA